MTVTKVTRRYALLLAMKDSDYVKKVYGSYFDVFVEAFGDASDGSETWDCFRVIDDELPSVDQIDDYDGFVISGSPHDAYGDELWILRLCYFLRTLDAMNKKILGICFGHQVLCKAFGGRVGKSESGWDIGVRKVTFVENLEGIKFLDGVKELPQCASIMKVHQDEVWEVPSRAEILAYSEKTGVEMFAIGDHVLGIQGHPEYNKGILNNLIDRLVNNNSINRSFGEAARKRVESTEPDRKFWINLCKGFLKGSQQRQVKRLLY